MARVRDTIQKMTPYNPPLEGRASQGYLLLDFNEMTTEPSPKVKQALHEFVDSGRVQVYPEYSDLNQVVAKYAGCAPEEVLVTNGSDQAIEVVMRAFVEKGDRVIIPSPSFAMEYQAALVQGAEIIKPEYQGPTLAFPFHEVLGLLDSSPRLLVLCNPNNPTGGDIPMEDVRRILEKAKAKGVTVLHDEAYFEFSGITVKEFIKDFDNLCIARTLSKQFGLASMRAGYVISQAENIQEFMKIRGPYDVNMFAATAIRAALFDAEYSRTYIAEVMQKAKPMLEEFFRAHGIPYYPSRANFLLIKPEHPEAVLRSLQEQGILVRPRKDVPGTLRISVGTVQDIERFMAAYSKAL
ncbi:MAG: histidinol-phosphate aminotransferase family protein [Candidatus Wildermuthbacteria bacterium]|nr:histidinol-phosphate aminotransferase family protein [Candidatus Wildermuthbacteria bacterium]